MAVYVALRKESVDRNRKYLFLEAVSMVALRKESVDRNDAVCANNHKRRLSLSARRAWIEIPVAQTHVYAAGQSLSARRAWIEISYRNLP